MTISFFTISVLLLFLAYRSAIGFWKQTSPLSFLLFAVSITFLTIIWGYEFKFLSFSDNYVLSLFYRSDFHWFSSFLIFFFLVGIRFTNRSVHFEESITDLVRKLAFERALKN